MKSTTAIVAVVALLLTATACAALGQPAPSVQTQQDAAEAALRAVGATATLTGAEVPVRGHFRATVEGSRYLSTRDVIVRIECGSSLLGYRCDAEVVN